MLGIIKRQPVHISRKILHITDLEKKVRKLYHNKTVGTVFEGYVLRFNLQKHFPVRDGIRIFLPQGENLKHEGLPSWEKMFHSGQLLATWTLSTSR